MRNQFSLPLKAFFSVILVLLLFLSFFREAEAVLSFGFECAGKSWWHFIVVGNIPYDTREEQLVHICEEVGRVVNFR